MPARRVRQVGATATSWSFDDWQEQCPSCLQSYCVDMQRRCSHCDGALCSFCVVEIEADFVCTVCEEVPNDGARDVEG
jgi:hypothetical protein